MLIFCNFKFPVDLLLQLIDMGDDSDKPFLSRQFF